jgi:hypothetical protein
LDAPSRADAPEATKADVEAHFASHGTGEITEIKLMNGFGFIEYKDAMDARDVVPGKQAIVDSFPSSLVILGWKTDAFLSDAAFRTFSDLHGQQGTP